MRNMKKAIILAIIAITLSTNRVNAQTQYPWQNPQLRQKRKSG